MKKWIDADGNAKCDETDDFDGYVPEICLDCGGNGCWRCDGDGVILVRPYADIVE